MTNSNSNPTQPTETTTTLPAPTQLIRLATKINKAQANIKFHSKSMLLEAKAAGEALIEAKKKCEHGEFKKWVEKNTEVSYTQSKYYMQVAKQWNQKAATATFSDLTDMSIREFLGKKDKPKEPTLRSTSKISKGIKKSASPDLDRALKLAPLAYRGVGGEKQVAEKKLFELYDRKDLVGLVVEAFKEQMASG
jgi:hypothetical protein